MDTRNFEYLKAQIKYTGFGDNLDEQLRAGMQKQLPEFTLHHRATFGGDQLTSALHFKRSRESELYFFNSYLATLKNQDQSQMLNQLFYIQRQGSVTLREAFNLMQGRAVEKQLLNQKGEQYSAWLQLDFKETDQLGNFKIRQFHQNYGFDLPGQIARLSLKELNEPESRARLLDSLRKGNRQQVTLLDGVAEHKLFLEASPQFKAVIAYDQNGARRQINEATQTRSQLENPARSLATYQAHQNDQGLSLG
ncbi:hypothetical protein LZD49_33250 [Dyadobacter sp. CY261]|uniref:hypothetical protein n=1 Tax=Dyadobacter sp. CY261 TaxID=2907203 RepID=UPI001F2116D2|nr:hypothetical protein [Dyadobacter sp. CY261]MCF0075393.1 hypothetical protein [Dyadobacter sp. CY261]